MLGPKMWGAEQSRLLIPNMMISMINIVPSFGALLATVGVDVVLSPFFAFFSFLLFVFGVWIFLPFLFVTCKCQGKKVATETA